MNQPRVFTLLERMTGATEVLITAHTLLDECSREASWLESELATLEGQKVLEGIPGKNAEERNAWLANETSVPRAKLEIAKRDVAHQRCRVTVNQLLVDLLKYELRILELGKEKS